MRAWRRWTFSVPYCAPRSHRRALRRSASPSRAKRTTLRIDYPAGRAEIHTFPLTDLATGFVRAWATGTDFSRWASVVVMTDWIDVDDIDTGEGRTLWDAVWSVAGGDEPADDTLGLARRLSGA